MMCQRKHGLSLKENIIQKDIENIRKKYTIMIKILQGLELLKISIVI